MSGTDGDIAERMASNQKQVAISEFFEKNKHFLGFDNPARSLITAVKEAVDNSLDAAEEAQILPDIIVRIHRVPKEKELYDLEVEDNGPGIPKNSIEKVFGRLLFGSRFHAIRQSRGQQGIGITGVVMNSMLTSGRPTKVISKIASEDTAVTMDVALDTKRNRANTSNVDRMIWVDDQGVPKAHGLHIRTRMRARFQSGRQSVEQYLRMTSIVNPHADIRFQPPDGEVLHWPRVTERLPRPVVAIKPHPHGIELGVLQRMIKETDQATIKQFLTREFSGVSMRAASEICEVAGLLDGKNRPGGQVKSHRSDPEKIRALLDVFRGDRGWLRPFRWTGSEGGTRRYIDEERRPGTDGAAISVQKHGVLTEALDGASLIDLVPFVEGWTDLHWSGSLEELREWVSKTQGDGPWNKDEAEAISRHLRKRWDPMIVFQPVKLLNPPTNCLSPIEDILIKKGLSKTIDSRFVTTLTRVPSVADGNPFQVEIGLIYGGSMPSEGPIEVLRFANRVPLMYQQGGCLLTKAIESVDWRQYGFDQTGGRGLPRGPAAVLVHLASTNVQFTSEAKEAISDNEIVFEELRKGMLEMGRGLRRHLEKRKKMAKVKEKFELVNDILPAIASKAAGILGRPVPGLSGSITNIMGAVIATESTSWDRVGKEVEVSIEVSNYTKKARTYTILTTVPAIEGLRFIGGTDESRREARGLLAWDLETLEPGEQRRIEYRISGLEKGDWTETEVFYRGSQEIIGADKMDEKLLAEIQRLEEAVNAEVDEIVEDAMGHDVNASGGLDEAEFTEAAAGVTSTIIGPEGPLAAHSDADADGDGEVTEIELKEFARSRMGTQTTLFDEEESA